MDKSAKNNKPDMTWFREATFGMFIHWGLYAIPGGDMEGRGCAMGRRMDYA